jgi:hypothetical protein
MDSENQAANGMRSSAKHWFHTTNAYYSLFTRQGKSSLIATQVYVDDLLLSGDNLAKIEDIKRLLDKHFSIKDLG